jgi:hypothetical protein
LEYAIRRLQDNQEGLKLNGTHQLLAYAEDNTLSKNKDSIQKNSDALLDACKEVVLEVNPEKTKYILVSHCHKVGQRQSIKIVIRSFEVVAKLKYLRTILTDQNIMNEEIESRLNSGNSVQGLLSCRLLSRNLKVKVYKTTILPIVCTGVKLSLSH